MSYWRESFSNPDKKWIGGEAGIRTRGKVLSLRRFSKPLVSATHPPLQAEFLIFFNLKSE
jgi:hypothetical protein